MPRLTPEATTSIFPTREATQKWQYPGAGRWKSGGRFPHPPAEKKVQTQKRYAEKSDRAGLGHGAHRKVT